MKQSVLLRITCFTVPYKTGIRLLGVALNPADGFPARLLEVHFSRNINRMRLHATLSLVAYQATALARAKEDSLENLRQMRVGMGAVDGLRMAA